MSKGKRIQKNHKIVIPLTPAEQLIVAPLHEAVKHFPKKYDIPASKLDADGLAARTKFFTDCDKLVEIYNPYFAKMRRQKTSEKGMKYQESVLKKGREGI